LSLTDPLLPVLYQITDKALAEFAAVPRPVIIIPVLLRPDRFILDNGAAYNVIPAPAPVKGYGQVVRGKFYFDRGTVEFGHGEVTWKDYNMSVQRHSNITKELTLFDIISKGFEIINRENFLNYV